MPSEFEHQMFNKFSFLTYRYKKNHKMLQINDRHSDITLVLSWEKQHCCDNTRI